MISYYLYWNNGKKSVVRGTTLTNALRRAKLGAEKKKDIEMFTTKDDPSIKWIGGKWIKTKKEKQNV